MEVVSGLLWMQARRIVVQLILGKFFSRVNIWRRTMWLITERLSYCPLYTTISTLLYMKAVSEVFEERIISAGIWPAYLPDLFTCDFFLGSFDRQCLCSGPRTEEWLKSIGKEIGNIPAKQLKRVNQNVFCQCEEWQRVEGRHFEHLLDLRIVTTSSRTLSTNRHVGS